MELQSENSNVVWGLITTDGNGVTLNGDRVNVQDCDEIMAVVHLEKGAAATAAQQATITVEQHLANSGGTPVTVAQEQVLVTTGGPDLFTASVTGKPVRTKFATPPSTYQSLVADGTNELLVQIPIRVQRLTSGYKFLSVKVTGLTAARKATIFYIRGGERYGADQERSLV